MITLLGSKMQVDTFLTLMMVLMMGILAVWYIVDWFDTLGNYSFIESSKISKSVSRITKNRETILIATSKRRQAAQQAQFFAKLMIFPYTLDKKEMLGELISKLDIRSKDGQLLTADEIYVKSCMMASASALIGLFVCLINPIGIVLIVCAPFLYQMPISGLKRQHLENIKNIELQMPEFISMFYYRFRDRRQVLRLDTLISDYLALANPSMRRMLLQLNTDLASMNDIEALKRLSERYPESNYVYSFCNVAAGIFRKQPNAYLQLFNLYSELKIIRENRYKEQLRIRSEKVQRAFLAIYLLFGIEMLIFIVFQIGVGSI